jgi:hypothetical protein
MAKPATPDPAIGIWKLNVGGSTFKIVPAPKSTIMKIEAWEDGLKISADTIDAQGNKLHPEVAYKFDGKDYPMKGSPLADAVSAKRINERAVENVWKKNGQVTLTLRAVISLDGRTITLTRTRKNAQGHMADEVLVYERQ